MRPETPPRQPPSLAAPGSPEAEPYLGTATILAICASVLASALLWWCLILERRIDATDKALQQHKAETVVPGYAQEKETWSPH